MPRKRKIDVVRTGDTAIAYLRVSTEMQVESGLGLEAQRKRIDDYCRFRGLELISSIEDHGVSAREPLGNREAGQQLMKELENQDVGHVVGLRLDRLFRDTVDCLSVVTDWDSKGITLHLVDLGGQAFDTKSATGRFFLTVLAAIAEWEALTISERTIAALERKKARDESLGAPPYGYEWELQPDGSRGGAIVECGFEQGIIEKIVRMRALGVSIRGIADKLNAEGVVARGDRWHHTTVDRILRRERKL